MQWKVLETVQQGRSSIDLSAGEEQKGCVIVGEQ